MIELLEGAGYLSVHANWTLIVTQKQDFVSVTVIDREQGNILGCSTDSADAVAKAQEIAARHVGIQPYRVGIIPAVLF